MLAWSQRARQKAGCLVRTQAVLPNRLMNAPRKPFPDLTPEGPDPGKPALRRLGIVPRYDFFL